MRKTNRYVVGTLVGVGAALGLAVVRPASARGPAGLLAWAQRGITPIVGSSDPTFENACREDAAPAEVRKDYPEGLRPAWWLTRGNLDRLTKGLEAHAAALRDGMPPGEAEAAGALAGFPNYDCDPYPIEQERVIAFCASALALEDTGGDRGPTSVPGVYGEVSYIYWPAEVAVLKPRCGKLLELLRATGATRDGGAPL